MARPNAEKSQRIETLRTELENLRAANHEMSIKIILHDLLVGTRHGVADLSVDVLGDLGLLVDRCFKESAGCLEKLRLERDGEGSPAAAAPPQPVEEAYEAAVVTETTVVALQAEGAPPLPAAAPPASAHAPGGEPRY